MDDRRDKSIIGRDAGAAGTGTAADVRKGTSPPDKEALLHDTDADCEEGSDFDIVFELETLRYGPH